jgi:3-deoxy-D-manno-octulosonic-acid transferase
MGPVLTLGLCGALLTTLFIFGERILSVALQVLIYLAGCVQLRGKTGEFLEDRSTQNWKLSIARAERLAREWKQLSLSSNSPKTPKIYWFHVASAGELEQAIPIARSLALDAGPSNCFFIVSYTSPSTKPFLKNFPNQDQLLSFALHPFSRSRIMAIMQALRPNGLFFIRYDLWPSLIFTARSIQVPLFLIGATRTLVRGGAIAAPSAKVKTLMLRNFKQIFALTQDDAKFYGTFLNENQITVAGEPKWARAKERANSKIPEDSPVFALRKLTNTLRLVQQTPVIVFGSPHKDEWTVLQRLLADPGLSKGFTIIAAPHDVGPAEISRLRAQLSIPGVRVFRLSQAKAYAQQGQSLDSSSGTTHAAASPVLGRLPESYNLSNNHNQEPFHPIANQERIVWLVDMMGYLAEVYGTADLAVVGGGFDGGLHNCLEPAAQGIPVLFGANHSRAPEAKVLLEADAARCFATVDEMFQFLKHCASVHGTDVLSKSPAKGATLPQMALNSAKLFESIPKTNQIIQAYLKSSNDNEGN